MGTEVGASASKQVGKQVRKQAGGQVGNQAFLLARRSRPLQSQSDAHATPQARRGCKPPRAPITYALQLQSTQTDTGAIAITIPDTPTWKQLRFVVQ